MLSLNRSGSLSLTVLVLCAAPLAGCISASTSDESDAALNEPIEEGTSALIASDVFQLRNVQAGTCLNVEGGSSALNAETHQWFCEASNGANLWRWVGTGEWRQLQNVQAGTCLNVEGGSSALNTNTHQWLCEASNGANLWKWVGTGQARQLVNFQAGTCLNVDGGSSAPNADAHQWLCEAQNPANQWIAEYPESCAAVRALQSGAPDGEYTLTVAGGPATIYCAEMAESPKEYLTLQHTGDDANFSLYTAGENSPGSDVTTHYEKIRIDPSTLLVDISDQRFATSTGQLMHNGSEEVTSMPYGVAMSCIGWYASDANIDLRGTPFAVAPNEFAQGGYHARGAATYSDNDQVVDLTGGGVCGWTNPAPSIYNPMNGAGGFQLNLVYSAPAP